MAQKATQGDPRQLNLYARSLVTQYSQEMRQPIYSQAVQGSPLNQQINIAPRNVGLIKRFDVELTCNLAQSAAETLTLTTLGPAAWLSNVTFVDMSNVTRINTTGWHLHMLATVRRGSAFGACFTNDSPVAIGNAYSAIRAPASVTTTQALRMFYEIPLAYSDLDLRGAMWANLVNATAQLSLTINPNFVASSSGNPVNAVYQSSTTTAAVPTGMNVTVWQVYLDQLPTAQNGAILPMLDLATIYYLNLTPQTGLAAGVDNAISYSNYREFYSTIVLYDNAGVLNLGTDVNRWKLITANSLTLFDVDVYYQALLTREEIGNDFPRGMYYFNHRKKPINTVQSGNMQLIANLASVTNAATSVLNVGWESMGVVNMVTQAGSLGIG